MKGLSFSEKKFTLLLNIAIEDIHLEKYEAISGFEPKSEFHLTLIGNYGGRELKNAINTFDLYYQYNAVEKIKALAFKTNWSYSFLDMIYHISKDYNDTDRRETIVQMVRIPALVEFYDGINKMLKTNLMYPLEHVTLFTKGTDPVRSKMGIGINSEIDFFGLNPVHMKL